MQRPGHWQANCQLPISNKAQLLAHIALQHLPKLWLSVTSPLSPGACEEDRDQRSAAPDTVTT